MEAAKKSSIFPLSFSVILRVFAPLREFSFFYKK